MGKLLKDLLGHLAPRFHPTAHSCVDPASTTVTLAEHDWRSIPNPAGILIECLRGRAVVTQEGDSRDQLLVAGDSHRVTRSAHLYVQAQREAELRFAMTMVATKIL